MKKYVIVSLIMVAFVLGIGWSERRAAGQAKKEPIRIGLLAERTGGLAA
jgi:hypothetical protein